MDKIKIAILASGSGTNAENICKYFDQSNKIEVTLIASNQDKAFVLERAKKLRVPSIVFTKSDLENATLTEKLIKEGIQFVILAGFLLKIPKSLIELFPERILNIHPALLPKYGGKGMYGDRVHQSVIDSGDHESGITIHIVNENYDEGQIIFQEKCEVSEDDDASSLASKIHKLEYKYFPKVIENHISQQIANHHK